MNQHEASMNSLGTNLISSSINGTAALRMSFVCVLILSAAINASSVASAYAQKKVQTAVPSIQELMEQGKEYLEKNNPALAMRSFSVAIRKNQNLAEAYFLRGRACDQIGNAVRAIQDFTKYIELKPSDPHGYVARADAKNFSFEHDSALEDYNKALKLSPTLLDAHLGRGLAYAGLERYQDAMKDYQWVLQRQPNHPDALLNLALAFMYSGKPMEAMSYFERALASESDPQWKARIEKWADQILNNPNLRNFERQKAEIGTNLW